MSELWTRVFFEVLVLDYKPFIAQILTISQYVRRLNQDSDSDSLDAVAFPTMDTILLLNFKTTPSGTNKPNCLIRARENV